MATWIEVRVSPQRPAWLELRFPFDRALKDALKADFGGEVGMLRWSGEDKVWLLRKGQFGALLAAYGARTTVHPAVWSLCIPSRRGDRVRKQRREHDEGGVC